MIYHVVYKADWEKALEQGYYEAPSIRTEGFIHVCHEHQLKGVLGRYYAGRSDLLLMHIDETCLDAPLKYENSPSVNDEFPHIYGKLNLNAVKTVEAI